MTSVQYDIMDELYFPIPFDELVEALSISEEEMKAQIGQMFQKGWVKILVPETDEIVQEMADFELNYKKYSYLASKTGLLAHNSR